MSKDDLSIKPSDGATPEALPERVYIRQEGAPTGQRNLRVYDAATGDEVMGAKHVTVNSGESGGEVIVTTDTSSKIYPLRGLQIDGGEPPSRPYGGFPLSGGKSSD